jgi:hypothetical protein
MKRNRDVSRALRSAVLARDDVGAPLDAQLQQHHLLFCGDLNFRCRDEPQARRRAARCCCVYTAPRRAARCVWTAPRRAARCVCATPDDKWLASCARHTQWATASRCVFRPRPTSGGGCSRAAF